MDDGFEGAIVLEPTPGIYLDDPVSVLDYASRILVLLLLRITFHTKLTSVLKKKDLKILKNLIRYLKKFHILKFPMMIT